MTKVWLRDDDSEEDIFKVAKKLKADYVEDDYMIFKCKKELDLNNFELNRA